MRVNITHKSDFYTQSMVLARTSVIYQPLHHLGRYNDLIGVVIGYVDCYSKGPEFKARVSHGPFQKFKHWIDNPVL
jgi:hypothetical protein